MITLNRVFRKVLSKELSLCHICEIRRSQLRKDSSGERAFWSEGTICEKK